MAVTKVASGVVMMELSAVCVRYGRIVPGCGVRAFDLAHDVQLAKSNDIDSVAIGLLMRLKVRRGHYRMMYDQHRFGNVDTPESLTGLIEVGGTDVPGAHITGVGDCRSR